MINTEYCKFKIFYDKKLKKDVFIIGFYGEGIFLYDMKNFKILGYLNPGYAASINYELV